MYWKLTIWRGREFSRPYRVWFFAEGEWFLSFCRCHRPRQRAALGVWGGWFKPRLEIRHAAALTAGAKHWHRQKAVFYVFVSVPPRIYPLNRGMLNEKKHPHRWGCGCLVLLSVWLAIIQLCRRYRALLWSCGCRVLPSSRVLDRSICVGRILLAFQWTPCEQQRWMPNESRYRCWFCKQRS